MILKILNRPYKTFATLEAAQNYLDSILPRPVYYSIVDENGFPLEGANDPDLPKPEPEEVTNLNQLEINTWSI